MNMAAKQIAPHLIERLMPVRGRLTADAPLAKLTWFRVGGPAEVLFEPADADDLAGFLAALPEDVPLTVIGASSNLLIRDGGVRGVVIKLGVPFAGIAIDGLSIKAGGAALDVKLAALAADAGIAGFEFLSGIPGTIGGAVRMNAGAYGAEIKDVIASVETIDRTGRRHLLSAVELGLSYRHSELPADHIVLSARLNGHAGEPEAISARIAEIKAARRDSQPVNTRTGGSTFANPPGAKAWELIDLAGCRGLMIGGAQVSPLHCNFLINTGNATAADLENLGETVIARVKAASGISLRWEIARIGEAL